ncbi:MAG TPA: CDP-alcohol phosphatidyltransferase family protein [Kofleriaceae bacterium]|nr:CDP-alcohol phosphatidyltransferase family protein [Kofleriaceae bacterium]
MFVAVLVVAFVVYGALCAIGRAPKLTAVKHNQLFGPFLAGFLVWVLAPIERALRGRVSPSVVTAASLVLCAATGLAVSGGHLANAVWLYALAGILDVLDGRLARQAGKPSAVGALFDSVSDRWGELFVFTGYAWLVHDSAWLFAVMAAIAGSMMVSYTRARAEGLGVELAGGVMQRAERIVLVALGTLVAAWVGVEPSGADLVAPIVGVTLALCGALSSATAINRWIAAHRAIAARERASVIVVTPEPEPVAQVARPAMLTASAELRKVRPLEQH